MPIRDPEARRRYHREWHARRRAAFFAGKACVACGSTLSLELNHRDTEEKEGHNIWSWSATRREAEIAKCEVRCRPCHVDAHRGEKRVFANARSRARDGRFVEVDAA